MIRNFIWPLIEFIGSYIFIMSLIVPVNPYSDEIHDYVFNVTYVNGDCKDILVNLPEDFKYGISNNKGSYYLEFTSEGKPSGVINPYSNMRDIVIYREFYM